MPVTVSTSDVACETNEPKGPMQQEARSAFLMSRKELPLSIVDVESQDSLDWGRGSDNGRMVEDIYCSITSYTLLIHFFHIYSLYIVRYFFKHYVIIYHI